MKKTIKKRAFVSAIAMLIVSAIVLTSSTFAWFSMSKQAEISAMDLSVSSASGIQISANAKAWTSSLDSAEFFNAPGTTRYSAYDGNRNLNPESLIPVSSALRAYTNGLPKFFQVILDENAAAYQVFELEQNPEKANQEGLLAFDLFFKLEEKADVYFGSTEITTADGEEDILSAMRIAYVKMGNVAANATPDAAIALTNSSYLNTTLYEYDAYSRSAGAEDQGNSRGIKTTAPISDLAAKNRGTNDNKIIEGAGTSSINCTLKQGQPFDADGNKRTMTNDEYENLKFNLEAGISKVRIYIWVEGQDIDCRNTVAGSELTVSLKFDIK